MTSRLTFNTNTQAAGNKQQVIDTICAMQPPYHHTLDDQIDGKYEFGRQIKARSPLTKHINRYHLAQWEGQLWRVPNGNVLMTPKDHIDLITRFYSDTYRPDFEQISNEPAPDTKDVPAMVAFHVAWMDTADVHPNKPRGCMLNMQTVAIRQSDLDNGLYDPLFFRIAKSGGRHILGLHEYGLAELPFNISDQWINALSTNGVLNTTWDIETVTSDGKQNTGAINQLRTLFSAHPEQAHLGRYLKVIERAQKIGAFPFTIVMTEIGWDNVRLGVHDAVERLNGRPPMGLPTLDNIWLKHFPQWTNAETAFKQARWLNNVYPYVSGLCLYSMDLSFENGQYHLGNNKPFLDMLIAYAEATRSERSEPIPEPPPTPEPDARAEIIRLLASAETALVGAMDAVKRARGLLP